MNDHPKDETPQETPMARALRMKKEAAATTSRPGGPKSEFRRGAAGERAGASKPAMRK